MKSLFVVFLLFYQIVSYTQTLTQHQVLSEQNIQFASLSSFAEEELKNEVKKIVFDAVAEIQASSKIRFSAWVSSLAITIYGNVFFVNDYEESYAKVSFTPHVVSSAKKSKRASASLFLYIPNRLDLESREKLRESVIRSLLCHKSLSVESSRLFESLESEGYVAIGEDATEELYSQFRNTAGAPVAPYQAP